MVEEHNLNSIVFFVVFHLFKKKLFSKLAAFSLKFAVTRHTTWSKQLSRNKVNDRCKFSRETNLFVKIKLEESSLNMKGDWVGRGARTKDAASFT